jgi:hypothetical protein
VSWITGIEPAASLSGKLATATRVLLG